MNIRTCLNCGLDNPVNHSDFRDRDTSECCPKCDGILFLQGNGRLLNRDIAHSRETVDVAMNKLEEAIQQVWNAPESGLRLIVGGGRIREEVLAQLDYYQSQGWILRYETDLPNEGAVKVWLR